MALNVIDRLLTVVVTATLTSAGWIVAGGINLNHAPPATILPPSPRASAGATAIAPAADREDLVVPVAGIKPEQLTDTFNDARGGGAQRHEALDIMAPAGTPVIAAGPGTIEKLFVSDAGGNTIYLRSPDRRTIHFYAHLQGYAPGLAEGQSVRQGQLLGRVGSTGDADPAAPHLHFQILRITPDKKWWEPTVPVNPYGVLAHKQ